MKQIVWFEDPEDMVKNAITNTVEFRRKDLEQRKKLFQDYVNQANFSQGQRRTLTLLFNGLCDSCEDALSIMLEGQDTLEFIQQKRTKRPVISLDRSVLEQNAVN